jgi:hypothetical protein
MTERGTSAVSMCWWIAVLACYFIRCCIVVDWVPRVVLGQWLCDSESNSVSGLKAVLCDSISRSVRGTLAVVLC